MAPANLASMTHHGVAPVAAAAVLAFAAVHLFWKAMGGTPVYEEPLIGGITWNHIDKGRDFRAFGLFLGVAVASALAIGGLFRRLSRSGPSGEVGRALNSLLWLSMAPSAWWLGLRIAYPATYTAPFEAAGAVMLVLASVVVLGRFRLELTSALVYDLVGGMALAVALGAMGGCGLLLLIGRVSVPACDALAGFSWVFAATGATIPAIAMIISARRAPDAGSLRASAFRVLLASQAPLPLLFAALIVPRIVVGTEVLPPSYSAGLPVGVGLLAMSAWVALALRWRSWERSGTPGGLGWVLSALCLSAVAVFYQVSTPWPPMLSIDHFHVGEQLLPWQQWIDLGQIPYVDFMPIHGLMPMVRGLFNELCFEGTAATFFMAEPLLVGLSAVVTFLVLSALVGCPAALLIGVMTGLAPGLSDRLYFMAPAVLSVAHPWLRARPSRWLLAWSVLCVAMVSYNPSVGAAFTMGTMPAGAWMTWRLLRETPREAALLGLIGLSAVLLIGLLTPAPALARGFLQFLAENARHNQVLHGLALEMSFQLKPDRLGISANSFMLQLLRYSWVLVAIAAGAIAWRELGRPRDQRRLDLLWASAITAAVLLWNAQWTMGRIDDLSLSRTGSQSVVVLAILLPALVVLCRSKTATAPILAALPMAVGLLALQENDSILRRLADRPLFAYRLAEGTSFVDGADRGLPDVGRVLIDPDHVLDEAAELKAALDPILGSGETYLDLTNRSSHYYYLGLPVPALYSANWIAGSAEMQGRMLDRLRERPVPAVLIGPAYEMGTGPASLRSYHLYREFVTRYVAVRRGRFLLLVDPSLAPEAGPIGSEEQLRMLDEVFTMPPLAKIPEAWGRSVRELSSQFQVVAPISPERLDGYRGADRLPDGDFSPTEPESELVYRIDDLSLIGRDADFLLLDFDYARIPGTPDAQIDVSWDTASGPQPAAFTFNAARSHLMVPLGAHPRWLLGEGFQALRIRVRTSEGFKRFSVSNIRLLSLEPAVGVARNTP